MASTEPVPLVTIPAGVTLLMKDLATADAAKFERALDVMYKKCTDHGGQELSLVRKAFIESGTIGTFAKLGRKVMENMKVQTLMSTIMKLLIGPPPKGKTDVSDSLRRSLIEVGYAAVCAEILGKYADQPSLVELCALNIQYLYNNPVSWDSMQSVVFGLVAPLLTAASKSSASSTAVAACIETLAFVAHVDITRRKGDWNVAAKLNDLECWNMLSNVALGKHGRSGRVAAAVMTLLYKSTMSPKATNFIRNMVSSGLVTTAIGYMRRSLVAPAASEVDQHGRERSVSPGPRGRGNNNSPSRSTVGAGSSSRPTTSSSTLRPSTSGSTMFAGTLTGTASTSFFNTSSKSNSAGFTSIAGTSSNNNNDMMGIAPARLRSYAEAAWNFVREVAGKSPETLLAGEPMPMVRLLLEPLLTPGTHFPHAKSSLGVVAHLIRSESFLVPFLSVGGASVVTALTRTFLGIEAGAALTSLDVLFSLSDIPGAAPHVIASGGFEISVEAFFVACRMNGNYSSVENLQRLTAGMLKLAAGGAGGIPTSYDSRERLRVLANSIVMGLGARKGDAASKVVQAAASLITWTVTVSGTAALTAIQTAEEAATAVATQGVEGAAAAEQAFTAATEAEKMLVYLLDAGAIPAICDALKANAVRDDMIGILLASLLKLIPTKVEDKSILEGSPMCNRGGIVITAIMDVLRLSVKREQAPVMEVWTPMFQLLEALIAASPANKSSFFRYQLLLQILSGVLEWSLNVCDAEAYKAWRTATRPPPEEDAAAGKHGHGKGGQRKGGQKGSAASPQKGASGGGAAGAGGGGSGGDPDAPTPPPEVPSQWIPARIVRLLLTYCGGTGTSAGGIQLRKALVHRKVGEYVWPWVCSLVDAGGLSEVEVDAGVTKMFLDAVWRVGSDGAYQGWEATGVSKEEIRAVMKKFPSWKPDPSFLV